MNLRQERNIGQTITAIFSFIQQNFKSLLLSLLCIAAPVALIAGYFSCNLELRGVNMNVHVDSYKPSEFFTQIFHQVLSFEYLSALFFLMLSYLLAILVVFSYVTQYLKNKNQKISVSQVWSKVKNNFVKVLFTSVFSTVIVFIITLLLVVSGIYLGSTLHLNGFTNFLIGSALLLPGVYLAILLCLSSFIAVVEKAGVLYSLNKSSFLVKGKWWSTFGLLTFVIILQWLIGLIFQMPSLLLSFATMLGVQGIYSKGLFIVTFILSHFGSLIMYTLISLAICFQYFNLIESKVAAIE